MWMTLPCADGAFRRRARPSATSSACTGWRSKRPPSGRGRTGRRASLRKASQLPPPRPYTTEGRAKTVCGPFSQTASSPRPLLPTKATGCAGSAPRAESCSQRDTPASRAHAASLAGVWWWMVSSRSRRRLMMPTQLATASQPSSSGMAADASGFSRSSSRRDGVRTWCPASRRRRARRLPIKPLPPSSRMFMVFSLFSLSLGGGCLRPSESLNVRPACVWAFDIPLAGGLETDGCPRCPFRL